VAALEFGTATRPSADIHVIQPDQERQRMWKKDEAMPDTPREVEVPRRPEVVRSTPSAPAGRAVIGPSIMIHGEVTGDEDLLIQGNVDGAVDLEEHALTVGAEGRVKANIKARVITVEGEVEGDLRARDQVVLRSQARVKGDITAPRVVLEDGANFRGLVDMGDANRASAGAAKTSQASISKSPPSGTASTGSGTKASESATSASATASPARAGRSAKDDSSSETVSKAIS
jgi:cytoskeletal protein CcmA (bactofilin family)